MIFASSPANSSTYVAASFASTKLISPDILIITSEAPSIVVSSNGLVIACFTASTHFSSPFPTPIPIWAIPLSDITVLTSAKSRLIKPGTLIKSVIP